VNTPEPGTPQLAAGVSHLLVADDVLAVGPQSSSFVAVCGAEVDTTNGAGDDLGYCPECVRAALRWRGPRSPGEHRPEPGPAGTR
jgi:hypothetical protein